MLLALDWKMYDKEILLWVSNWKIQTEFWFGAMWISCTKKHCSMLLIDFHNCRCSLVQCNLLTADYFRGIWSPSYFVFNGILPCQHYLLWFSFFRLNLLACLSFICAELFIIFYVTIIFPADTELFVHMDCCCVAVFKFLFRRGDR